MNKAPIAISILALLTSFSAASADGSAPCTSTENNSCVASAALPYKFKFDLYENSISRLTIGELTARAAKDMSENILDGYNPDPGQEYLVTLNFVDLGEVIETHKLLISNSQNNNPINSLLELPEMLPTIIAAECNLEKVGCIFLLR